MLKTVHDRERSSSHNTIAVALSLSILLFLLGAGACIAGSCSIKSATDIVFPAYNPLSPNPSRTEGSIVVECDSLVRVRVLLDAGSSGNCSRRSLQGSRGDELLYNLYVDASCKKVWGDREQETQIQTFAFGEGGGSARFPVYGQIEPKQNVAEQVFQGKIAITVEW